VQPFATVGGKEATSPRFVGTGHNRMTSVASEISAKPTHMKDKQREPDYEALEGFVRFDFLTLFPHRFWISNWASDEEYLSGYRYKVLSVRQEPEGLIELVVLIENSSGAKKEMTRLKVSASLLDRSGQKLVDQIAGLHGLDFEMIDLSDVRTEDEFVRRVDQAGWTGFSVQ